MSDVIVGVFMIALMVRVQSHDAALAAQLKVMSR
jgi:hypothetical protein